MLATAHQGGLTERLQLSRYLPRRRDQRSGDPPLAIRHHLNHNLACGNANGGIVEVDLKLFALVFHLGSGTTGLNYRRVGRRVKGIGSGLP